jgi:hypothetical protein
MVCLLASIALTAPALGAEPQLAEGPARAIEVALGVGYGAPLGGYGKTTAYPSGVSLDYWINGQVPVSLDIGYRINRRFVIGAFGQYGFGFLDKDHTAPCSGSFSCSARVVRVDVGGVWNILPEAALAPWIGLAVGYEWFTTKQEGNGLDVSVTARGPELANLRGGVDFTLARGLCAEPFFSLSFGRYSDISASTAAIPPPSFTEKQIHEWLVVGVRGRYDIGF